VNEANDPNEANRGPSEASGERVATAPRTSAEFTFAPLGAVAGNLAAVLAESMGTLLALFYPPVLCRKANIVVTELVQNVMENVAFPESDVKVGIVLDGDRLRVKVTNRVTREQEAAVSKRLAELGSVADAKKLFADTIRARRQQRLKGGIGLMRLVAENRFRLSSEYDGSHLTVSAEFDLRGLQ
jgi:hypothetical protein